MNLNVNHQNCTRLKFQQIIFLTHSILSMFDANTAAIKKFAADNQEKIAIIFLLSPHRAQVNSPVKK